MKPSEPTLKYISAIEHKLDQAITSCKFETQFVEEKCYCKPYLDEVYNIIEELEDGYVFMESIASYIKSKYPTQIDEDQFVNFAEQLLSIMTKERDLSVRNWYIPPLQDVKINKRISLLRGVIKFVKGEINTDVPPKQP